MILYNLQKFKALIKFDLKVLNLNAMRVQNKTIFDRA